MNGGDDGTRTRGLCRDSSIFTVTSCNFTAPIATSGALRNPREVLLHPYCTLIAPRFATLTDDHRNVHTDSDGAWDFKPIFVNFQTLDFRVQRARRQTQFLRR